MEYRYKTKGVCSSQIILDIEGDTVKSAMFIGVKEEIAAKV